jgi:hypothetical protein
VIPFEFLRLAHLTRLLLAAEHHKNEATAGRIRREVGEVLVQIGDQLAAEDAAGAAAEDPGPDPPPPQPWLARNGGLVTRTPGRTDVELMAGEMLAELGRLARLPAGREQAAAAAQVRRWLTRLTGWDVPTVEHLVYRVNRPAAEGGVR